MKRIVPWRFFACLAFALLLGAPLQPAEMDTAGDELEKLEKSLFEAVNRFRISRGKTPLTLDPKISRECRAHSADMAGGKRPMGHEGFDQRIENLKIAWKNASENVGYNAGYSNPVLQNVEGWVKSPEHSKNMLGTFDLAGVGIAKNKDGKFFFTMIFIRTEKE